MGKLAYFHRVAAHTIFDPLHQDIPHKQTQAYFILTKLLPSHFPKGQDGLVHFGMLNPNQCRFAIT